MQEKTELIRRFTEAFATNDLDFIIDQVTDNIVWNMVGVKKMEGKQAFLEELASMPTQTAMTITLTNIITHGRTASAEGTVAYKSDEGAMKTYSFCDVYEFNGFKNAKIKGLTSYIIETTEAGQPVESL